MHKRRSKRLNLKVALLLPIVLAILAGGGYGLHQLQVGRTARKMLDRAKQAQARAEARLTEQTANMDMARAEASLKRAILRLRATELLRTNR